MDTAAAAIRMAGVTAIGAIMATLGAIVTGGTGIGGIAITVATITHIAATTTTIHTHGRTIALMVIASASAGGEIKRWMKRRGRGLRRFLISIAAAGAPPAAKLGHSNCGNSEASRNARRAMSSDFASEFN